MQANIVSIPGIGLADAPYEIASAISKARSLSELLLWVGDSRRFLFTARELKLTGHLEVGFMQGEQVLAVASLAMSEILKSLPDYAPLNEAIFAFDDQPGYRPDDAWFDQRNQRLSIKDCAALNMNLSPPNALSELIVSYAFSTAGYAEVLSAPGPTPSASSFLQLNLVFFGTPENGLGWREQVACSREALEFAVGAGSFH